MQVFHPTNACALLAFGDYIQPGVDIISAPKLEPTTPSDAAASTKAYRKAKDRRHDMD